MELSLIYQSLNWIKRMPYNIKSNYKDCSGYAVVGPDGKIFGCHSTKEKASNQQSALYASEEKVVKSSYALLDPSEKAYHDALVSIANEYGGFNNNTPVYAGYEPPAENENILKGIICGNCAFYEGEGVCHIVSLKVEYNGYCRLAAIPSELVNANAPDIELEEEMDKAASVSVGQMVSWNSSGGRAEGKVKRILRSGSYNVPNSDFTITGTEENPAVVIELYTDGKPSGRMVGHRMNTLSAKKSVWSGTFDPRMGISKNG